MKNKMKLPLIIVSIDDGVSVKGSHHKVKLYSNTYRCKNVKNLRAGDEIYISYSTAEQDTIASQDIETSITYTGPIGLKVKVKKMVTPLFPEQENQSAYIEYEAIDQGYISEIMVNDEGVFGIVKPVSLKDDFADKVLIEEMQSFILFIVSKTASMKAGVFEEMKSISSIMDLCDKIMDSIVKDPFEKYIYLQTVDEAERLKTVVTALLDATDTFIDLNLKDFIMLNQIKDMDKPLIESTPPKKKKASQKYPPHVREALEKESKRLSRTPTSSQEAQAIQTYIETVSDLPWLKFADTKVGIETMVDSITSTHYGLEDIKEHVLEHLVLENHVEEPIGTVLCFVGPPGTGKTSIAKAIAKATNREVVRIALGGVSDEAEIRGHRRTYVAAKPGRLVDGLIKAKQINPVIILDEVDKIDQSPKGDPTSALLELLDPEQNSEFVDRYIELPIDMSKALFICTANYEDRIPEALKDRLELIYFKEYAYEDRLEILKKYIYPSLIKSYKMEDMQIHPMPSFYEEMAKDKSLRVLEKNISKILKSVLVLIKIKNRTIITLDDSCRKFLNKTKSSNPKIGFNNGNNCKK